MQHIFIGHNKGQLVLAKSMIKEEKSVTLEANACNTVPHKNISSIETTFVASPRIIVTSRLGMRKHEFITF
jgi:hypothetical protein